MLNQQDFVLCSAYVPLNRLWVHLYRGLKCKSEQSKSGKEKRGNAQPLAAKQASKMIVWITNLPEKITTPCTHCDLYLTCSADMGGKKKSCKERECAQLREIGASCRDWFSLPYIGAFQSWEKRVGHRVTKYHAYARGEGSESQKEGSVQG